jgi:hypothetical protein
MVVVIVLVVLVVVVAVVGCASATLRAAGGCGRTRLVRHRLRRVAVVGRVRVHVWLLVLWLL